MKTGTPVPKRDVEMKATGSGPVVTYTLPPEELAKIRPTREKYLQLRAAGMTHTKIEKELGIPEGSLSYWLRKWNLKGITREKASELIKEDATGTAEPDRPTEDTDLYREVAEKLFIAAPVAIDLEPDPAARVIAAEVELHRQKDEMIERLKWELAEKSVRINELERAVNQLETERDQYRKEIEQLKAANTQAVVLAGQAAEKHLAEIEQLKFERDALLRTIEKAIDDTGATAANHDPVNHSSHYTTGRIECIDAIESATNGLTGGLAYCTGAAIKYLWRWSRKDGVQDLRKARWYVDRLIQLVEEGEQSDAAEQIRTNTAQ